MRVKRMLVVGLVAAAFARSGFAADVADDHNPAAMRVKQEHRYRLSAAIRPLLFWVWGRNVGGARIVWRDQEDGRLGYELLIGSDPARAPRKINRWGFVREDGGPSGATMVGVMNRSEDDSLTNAESRMAQQAKEGRFLFKMIHAQLTGGETRAENMVVYAPSDFNFRELEDLQRYVEQSRPPIRPRTSRLPADTRPGLLFATADLVSAGVAAGRAPGNAGPALRKVQYTFNAALYDLVLKSWERVARGKYGKRAYERLVRLEFESRNLEKGNIERFMLICATEGPLAGVPVVVQYQPRWWFKIEGALDEDEPL